jgi:Phosphomannomutase
MALFGTDGIRGLANRDLTAELALDVSVAAAHYWLKAHQIRTIAQRQSWVKIHGHLVSS